jgi:ABC-type bacteriocin/lantibiotic exporter with double-glycine peptidase domain
MKINYIHEPTDLQCGQAVLAMVLGFDVNKVTEELGNERETTLTEMKEYLRRYGAKVSDNRISVNEKGELPPLCLLSLETPRCWHWSLFSDGVFYDPEHGVMDDFPACARKYYWEINL